MISYVIFIVLISLLCLKLYLKLSMGVCKNQNSMDGKVIIVSGANSGIGFETARELASRKGKVILACRNLDKGRSAANEIINSTGNTNVSVKHINLASLDSVRKFAAEINATEKRLDVLIHNAANPIPDFKLTEDNLEEQIATNHFGPFLLTHLLLDLLKMSAPSRIIILSSRAHRRGNLDWNNLNCEKKFEGGFKIYCNTKLANILFARELSRRLKGSGVTVNSLHPGIVDTKIFQNTTRYVKILLILMHPFLKDVKSGAQTSIYLATADEVRDISGQYFVDCRPTLTFANARDDYKAKTLYEKSMILTKIK